MTETLTVTRISLEAGCGGPLCDDLAQPTLAQLEHGYELCSVLPLPESLDEWRAEHRTARKRARRAGRLGYHFQPIQYQYFTDDIYRINVSLAERQGRPMTPGYVAWPSSTPDPVYTCPRHRITRYGVIREGVELVAYLWLYRAGELALVSQILGHGQHLRNDVMYLLAEGVIAREIACGGLLVYNRHDSGTDGLRYYKERIGFQPMEVSWTP